MIEVPEVEWFQNGANPKVLVKSKTSMQNNNSDVEQTSSNYNSVKFVDLFWFINFKKQMNENELDLVTLSFNLNFGNIRFNGYKNSKQYLHGQAIFLQQDALVANGAVYPAGVFELRNLSNQTIYRPIEQLFTQYNPSENLWQSQLASLEFQKSNDQVKLIFNRNNNQYYYIFDKHQTKMLNHAFDIVLNNGFNWVTNNK